MAKNLPHITHKKPKTQNIFLLHTQRLAKPLEGLNSSLAQSTSELWSSKMVQN